MANRPSPNWQFLFAIETKACGSFNDAKTCPNLGWFKFIVPTMNSEARRELQVIHQFQIIFVCVQNCLFSIHNGSEDVVLSRLTKPGPQCTSEQKVNVELPHGNWLICALFSHLSTDDILRMFVTCRF